MQDDAPRELLGQRFGNYVLTRKLGEGGMGAVFEARHPEIGRQVAVKVLAPHLARFPGVARRFVAEARAVTCVAHPNVIEIYDFGRDLDGELYIIMELLQGRELMAVMDGQGRMTPGQALPFVEQIAAGLQAAHDQGVVHRDLKPENIFVLDRTPLALKILDFGIAKVVEDDSGVSVTATGMIIGSPLTMAPEQAAGQKDRIGPRTDIYSLGVIIYWMLAGRPPFHSESAAMLLAEHIKEPPPPIVDLVPGLPPAVAGLVHRCMEKHPGDRPAAAREVAQELRRAAGPAIPPTLVHQGRLAYDSTMPALALEATVPAAAAAERTNDDDEDAPTIEAPVRIPPTVQQPSPAPRSPLPWIALGAAGAVALLAVLGAVLVMVYWPAPAGPPNAPPRPAVAPVGSAPMPAPALAPAPPLPASALDAGLDAELVPEAPVATAPRKPARRRSKAAPRRSSGGARVIVGRPAARGALSPEAIRVVVRRGFNEVKYCYTIGLARNPELAGRVVYRFTINAAGRVPAIELVSSNVPDAEVVTCLGRAIARWRFPPPAGGGNVVVSYPFILRTSPAESGD